MYFGYAIAVNPAAAYQAQYQAMLMKNLQKEIGALKAESLKDDYQRGYEALIRGDTERAIRFWEKESNLGVTQASKALGDLFHFKTKELAKAINYYDKAAQMGDLESSALIIAAKYHLDSFELSELSELPIAVQEQPWVKYVKACLMTQTSEIDEDSEVWDLLGDAIEAGIVQAVTMTGWVLKKLGQLEKAKEMFLVASSHGDNPALIELVKIELNQNGLPEATEAVFEWEGKYEWDEAYSYDICSILRFIHKLPRESGRTRENVKQAINVASLLWSGYKKIDTAWDVFEQEIVRPQHNYASIPLSDLYVQAYQFEGKHSAKVAETSLLMIIESYCSKDTVDHFLNFAWLHPILNYLLDLTSVLYDSNAGDLESLTSEELAERSAQLKFVRDLLHALHSQDWKSFKSTYKNLTETPDAVSESLKHVLYAIS
jgi:hypothetical protein